MRGEVLSFDTASGAGWISGEDGARYSFTTADLGQPIPVSPGAKLDFVPAGTTATQIFAAPQAAFTADAAATASSLFAAVTPDPTGEPDMSYFNYFKKCLRKYADFTGRANRKEYWSFMGAYIALFMGVWIIQMVVSVFFGLAGAVMSAGGRAGEAAAGVGGLFGALFGLVVFLLIMAVCFGLLVPSLAVTTRRLHDAGLTGWFTLSLFVVGGVATIVIGILETQPGRNIYGGYTLPGGASPPPPPQPYAPPPPATPVA